MNNKVTDLETSRKLQPHMSGVKTEFCYVNGELHIIAYDGLPMSLKSGHRIASKVGIIPAYDLQDILGVLPKVIDANDIKYFIQLSSYIHSISGNKYFRIFYKPNCQKHGWLGEQVAVNRPITNAAARLLLWTVSEGYVGGDK